ncbi:MAG: ribonuclease III [Geoalkalibacter sp.]|jgi:ribonuclease-3|uniref:ribonuclease III n=1 Tax=Geoalkalibacter sp. TaxID=3041440 RepID=UPI002A997C2B|nr:ribonuclease III [Thermodesulfobacteriota bacterium]
MAQEFNPAEIEKRIGYCFACKDLLRTALTHRSFVNEAMEGRGDYNERLEFLGDAVLQLVVSRFIFDRYPHLPEGDLTRIRAEVVSEKGLAEVARRLELGGALLLGRGEDRSGGRRKASLLSNAFEALLGAVFRDGGFDAAIDVAERLLREQIEAAQGLSAWTDYKTRLQEYFQGRHGRPPAYRLASVTGPEHDRVYRAEVVFDDEVVGQGQGRTKKAAQQAAARQALDALES